ncbi:MAG TPA: peroxiredoxin-like family protein [Sphingomonadales bacterium]|nr:peroxiredoxin-like family protein [Sphingomonadales bacterium]
MKASRNTVHDPMAPYMRIYEEVSCLDAALAKKLATHFERIREINPELISAYEETIARWKESGVGGGIPHKGSPFPDFVLPDHEGKLVALHDLLRRGHLVISFNRGHWCPYCHHELTAIKRIYREIRARGSDAISIMPEKGTYARRSVENLGLPFPVLCDIDHTLALACGLMVPVGVKLQAFYRKMKMDLPTFQGNPGWNITLPGTFVLDPSGRVLAALASPDLRERMAPETILAALPKRRFRLFS